MEWRIKERGAHSDSRKTREGDALGAEINFVCMTVPTESTQFDYSVNSLEGLVVFSEAVVKHTKLQEGSTVVIA